SIIESPYNPDLVGATADSLLVEGMQIMVPNGNGGDCNIWVAQAASDSGDGTGGGTSLVDISQPIDYYGLNGCNFTLGQGGWPGTHPVLNSQFFQGFSAYHTGVDFSASPGTPIVASGAGTVIFAGWNQYGYGNTVVIAHASTFTLYAHMLNRPN